MVTSTYRYSKLGYVAFNVADLVRSKQFYETLWGLQFNGTGPSGEIFFRCSKAHHDVVLYEANRPGLKRLGWQLESERELDVAAGELAKSGISIREVAKEDLRTLQQGRSFRFTCPFSGTTHEYYASAQEAGAPFARTVADIKQLGHVVLRVSDYEEAVSFYEKVLNFRVSDRVEKFITFMRCFPNPYHHSLALAKGAQRGLHHVCFMVNSLDDVGRALWRLRSKEVPIVYGPGRHPPSSSVFLYVLDPDQMTVEYSFGMEEFPELNPRQARLLPPSLESLDFWGAPLDPRMGATGEIEVDRV
jgi:2,3-dihydroxy-p-cumate/2,3-dihydroxybenzoate 3,4-dioxygenase